MFRGDKKRFQKAAQNWENSRSVLIGWNDAQRIVDDFFIFVLFQCINIYETFFLYRRSIDFYTDNLRKNHIVRFEMFGRIMSKLLLFKIFS